MKQPSIWAGVHRADKSWQPEKQRIQPQRNQAAGPGQHKKKHATKSRLFNVLLIKEGGKRTYNLAQNTQISEKMAKTEVMMENLGNKWALVAIQKCFYVSWLLWVETKIKKQSQRIKRTLISCRKETVSFLSIVKYSTQQTMQKSEIWWCCCRRQTFKCTDIKGSVYSDSSPACAPR